MIFFLRRRNLREEATIYREFLIFCFCALMKDRYFVLPSGLHPIFDQPFYEPGFFTGFSDSRAVAAVKAAMKFRVACVQASAGWGKTTAVRTAVGNRSHTWVDLSIAPVEAGSLAFALALALGIPPAPLGRVLADRGRRIRRWGFWNGFSPIDVRSSWSSSTIFIYWRTTGCLLSFDGVYQIFAGCVVGVGQPARRSATVFDVGRLWRGVDAGGRRPARTDFR